MKKPECFGTDKVKIRNGKIHRDCLMCSIEDECRKMAEKGD